MCSMHSICGNLFLCFYPTCDSFIWQLRLYLVQISEGERSQIETLKVRIGPGSSCSNHRPVTVKTRINNSDGPWPGECLHPLVRRCTIKRILILSVHKSSAVNKSDILRAGWFDTLPYTIMGDLPASESDSHTASSVPQPSGQHNSSQ